MSEIALQNTPASDAPDERAKVLIKPAEGWAGLQLGEIWRYRDLLWMLAEREVKLRYKQTALGVVWVIIQPLVAALIFTIVFGYLAKMDSDGKPYLLFSLSGMVAWSFFANALQRASNSLVSNANLISKVYFPRLIIPLSNVLAVMVDLAVMLAVLIVTIPFYDVGFTWRFLTLPGFLILIAMVASGIAFWCSALSVKYRDFVYALPFLTQAWMYATPVVYAASLVPEKWRLLYSVNPLVGCVEGVRWATLGDSSLNSSMLLLTIAGALIVFISGAVYFRRVEREFADVI